MCIIFAAMTKPPKPLTPLKILGQMQLDAAKAKYNNIPYLEHYAKVKCNNANSLTQAIIRFIKLSGGQAERISTMGRVIDKSYTYTNVLGQKCRAGSSQYIPGTGTKGSADISAIIRTNSSVVIPWRIEVKWGKDRVSKDQLKYKDDVTKAGGHYSVVMTFDDFFEQYNAIIAT